MTAVERAPAARMGEAIDLNLLPVLHALLESGSVTQAAARLDTSQPAISRALGRLRRLAGDPLLARTNAGMTITDRGSALATPLQQWSAATRALLRGEGCAAPADFVGSVRLATLDAGVMAVLAPAFQRIATAAPGIRIDVLPLCGDGVDALSRGEVDLVIGTRRPGRGSVHELRLQEDGYLCLLRLGHPALQGCAADGEPRLALDQFVAWPHLVVQPDGVDDPVARALHALGRSRRIAASLPYVAAAPHLLRASDAIAVMPAHLATQMAAAEDLQAVGAPLELGVSSYWLLWHERTRRDAPTQWVAAQLRG
jgi:DNA-binding transcriptional LysR family regulator